jgi:hypothetical protein
VVRKRARANVSFRHLALPRHLRATAQHAHLGFDALGPLGWQAFPLLLMSSVDQYQAADLFGMSCRTRSSAL